MEPFQIIAAPFNVWAAPVGTAFPVINAAPSGAWIQIGAGGANMYGEDGVIVQHEEELQEVRTLGFTGPVKALRTSEGLTVRFTLHDVRLDHVAHALNMNTVTTVAAGTGTPGHRRIGLAGGLTVEQRALLVRGPSPEGAGWNMQYELARGVFRIESEVGYQKGEPAGYTIAYRAMVNMNATDLREQFGVLRVQHAAPL